MRERKPAQENALITDGEKYKGMTESEKLQAMGRDMYKAPLPGPKWYRNPDGSIELAFITEEWDLFPALMEHLHGTNLDAKFLELKQSLKQYIELCISPEGKTKPEELNKVPKITIEYEKSERLAKSITDELKYFVYRGEFPGWCRFCKPR